MSELYSEKHRKLQEQFDSQRMADLMEEGIRHDELEEKEIEFIRSRDMFFLTTVDPNGRPTVSYKGGDKGFLRVLDTKTLMFPSYDGNGMYYSMGNLMQNPKVGLLLIDFETPHRLRIHGTAEVSFDEALVASYPEAQFVAKVAIEDIWINCPRYIHKYQRVETSKYVPKEGQVTPAPAWKRIDIVQDALPKKDQGRAEQDGGLLEFEDYEALVSKGEG